jgi:2-phosphoglycerate kinase
VGGAAGADRAGAAALRARLDHVRWVGGGSGAGKSTTARAVAARHGLHLLATDDAMADHARRCPPQDCPRLQAFIAMTLDQRWVERSPQTMLETFPWFAGEGFSLVVEDLLRLPASPGVVVEGFRLLPRLVAPLLADPSRAVWLLPTPAFRRAAFDSRGSTWQIARRTSDPPAALANLLERDRLFTERLAAEVAALGLRALEVDTGTTQDALTALV